MISDNKALEAEFPKLSFKHTALGWKTGKDKDIVYNTKKFGFANLKTPPGADDLNAFYSSDEDVNKSKKWLLEAYTNIYVTLVGDTATCSDYTTIVKSKHPPSDVSAGLTMQYNLSKKNIYEWFKLRLQYQFEQRSVDNKALMEQILELADIADTQLTSVMNHKNTMHKKDQDEIVLGVFATFHILKNRFDGRFIEAEATSNDKFMLKCAGVDFEKLLKDLTPQLADKAGTPSNTMM